MKRPDNKLRSASTAVEFRHVFVSLDGKRVLKDLSFEAEHGEMVFITGASGSGKTTLLRLAIGLLRPDEGQIFIDGREIEQLSEQELLAIRGGQMGMVFQEEALFTGLSVYDNAAYRLSEHGWSEAETERAVGEVLHFVGLESDADRLPDELSGGMKRRVEIARALIGWPSIMLYDEPTSGLDPLTAAHILDLVIRARDVHGITSLYVTKELHEIPYLASRAAAESEAGEVNIRETDAAHLPKTRVLLLEEGEIVWTGTPAEFERSALPVVTHMTHPETGARMVDFYIPDPWSKKRRPREEIL
ncbi:MAG TPA: ATP-binding cassette domain-containing protein [Pyrinomonadaceae bacterium]|jgi:phospholipid/cholesterol/gamma-HCH transport system ATP-binding protein|nr:ATP-binding cassette domain-containing protein [Pyrinomonadaceae bacterium]